MLFHVEKAWILLLNLYPSLFAVALYDPFTNDKFSQAIGKGGEGGVFRLLSFTNGGIYFLEHLFGGIRKSFVVPTRKTDQACGFFRKQSGILYQLLVCGFSFPDPHFVGLFRTPFKI